MEYPNFPERKLIDIPATSRASRGTCKIIMTRRASQGPQAAAASPRAPFFLLNFFEQQSEQKIQHISIQQHCKDEEQFYNSPFIYNSIFGHTNFWNNSNLNCILRRHHYCKCHTTASAILLQERRIIIHIYMYSNWQELHHF